MLAPSQPAPSPFENPVSDAPKRVVGLNALRFFAALCVAIDHLRPIPFIKFTGPESSTLFRGLEGLLGAWIFNGPAAVIVFFVISGFCIHLPYAGGNFPQVIEFYARRSLRLFLPLPFAVLLSAQGRVPLGLLGDSILWSLTAELIYYFLYPFLLILIRNWGWRRVLLFSFIGAGMVIATNPFADNYPSYGTGLNWLLGLPCWLLGCHLAETYRAESKSNPMKLRLAVFAVTILVMLLRHHTPIGYPITLTLYSILIYFWLRAEIPHLSRSLPSSSLWERAGNWSYSLYLVHLPLGAILTAHGFSSQASIGSGLIFYSILLTSSYLFYRLIEKPAQSLSRNLKIRPRARLRQA